MAKREVKFVGDVPLPSRELKYDFGKMKINDAFVVSDYSHKEQNTVRALAAQWSRRYTGGKAKFAVRKYHPIGQEKASIFVKRLPDNE